MTKRILFLAICFCSGLVFAQPAVYTTSNAHSHNDYEKDFPFWGAWRAGFGSMEADVFLAGDEILVAHDTSELKRHWLFDSLYLKPLVKCIRDNGGSVFPDKDLTLQLLIDLKTPVDPLLGKVIEQIGRFPELVNNPGLKVVITGNRPAPSSYSAYPSWVYFDGDLDKEYTKEQLRKIAMLSENFSHYSSWNGKNRLPDSERKLITSAIEKAHASQKKVRFWNAPDILNSWYGFMSLGVDYINTDKITAFSTFLKQMPDRSYESKTSYELYRPTYRNDGADKPVKNIILLIGDGTGLPQWYAGYTANRGALNVFNMRYTGLSKTSSYDNYITDSAPGATALSSGVKTNNRSVGVDHTGKAVVLLPQIVRRRGMRTGIITSGDITDATPADFYAHQSERSESERILGDLLAEPVDLLAGRAPGKINDTLRRKLAERFNWIGSIGELTGVTLRKPVLVTEERAGRYMLDGRGDWAVTAFSKAIDILAAGKSGFFLMQEGAKIDHGGHANKLPNVVTEVFDFDQVIGRAMEFADSNGETLVIVTADHETGGLTLTGGDYERGYVSGQFSTEDHTALPVPVFAYGPQSQLFSGTYENMEIFIRILRALKER